MKTTIAGFVLCLLLVPRSSAADAFTINVIGEQHTTTVAQSTLQQVPGQSFGLATESRTQTGDVPVEDRFHSVSIYGRDVDAKAKADVFSVFAQTNTDYASLAGDVYATDAFATTTLVFQPLMDALVPLSVAFVVGGDAPVWSNSRASLTDLTTGLSLFTLGWDFFSGTNGWLYLTFAVPFTFTPFLDATHQYSLTLLAHTQSNTDSQIVTATITGLTVSTPEPSTLLLLGAGLVGLASKRRHLVRS